MHCYFEYNGGNILYACVECEDGHPYIDEQCNPYPENCKSCMTDPSKCDVGSCEEGYGVDESRKCSPCRDHCEKCPKYYNVCHDDQYNSFCSFGYGLSLDENGTPTGNCAEKDSNGDFTGKCVSCPQNCIRCNLYSTQCLECEDSYSLNSANTCVKCPNNCIECNADNLKCLTCAEHYGLNSDSQCKECPENCAKCDKDTSKCTKCLEGFEFEIFNGTLTNKCVSFIYDGTFDIDINGTTSKEVTKKQKTVIIAVIAVLVSIGVISSAVTSILFLKTLSSDYGDELENNLDDNGGANAGYNENYNANYNGYNNNYNNNNYNYPQ